MGEGFFMYHQPEAVLEQYDLEIRQIMKGRGVYICDTDQGIKILTPFRGSAARAEFLRQILCALWEEGFPAEQVCVTKEGASSAEDEGGTRYWLKDRIAGSECSTSREEDMTKALEQLARFHIAAKAVAPEAPELLVRSRSEPVALFRRHGRELVKVKNYIHARHSHNELERLFLEQYPYYIAQAESAVDGMEACVQSEGGTRTVCHGAFHQHNVLRTPQGMRIVNFETMCWNEPVVDLANFVRKMMEKNQWDVALGMGLLESYDRVRPLSPAERQLLGRILLFPEKFWKISNHYYNSHKAWVSERDIQKFRQIVTTESKRARFLENLFYFCDK
jgi:CotS family spore coat protein